MNRRKTHNNAAISNGERFLKAVYLNYLGRHLYPGFKHLYYTTLLKRTCCSKTDKTSSKLQQYQQRTQIFTNNFIPVNINKNEIVKIFKTTRGLYESFLRI